MVTHDQILKRIARAMKSMPDVTLVKRGLEDDEIVVELDDGAIAYISVRYEDDRQPFWGCGEG